MVQAGFWWGDRKERHNLKDIGVNGSVILKWIFRKWDMKKIHMAQDRDRCRALVNAVMNVLVQINAVKFFVSFGLESLSERNLLHAVS